MKFAVSTSSLAALCRIRNSRIACAGGEAAGRLLSTAWVG